MLDGQTVDTDKPFKVDGYELMYPGDRNAPGYLVYNCRCTTIAVLPDVDTSDAQRWSIDPKTGERKLVSDMTYQEWAGWKEKEQKTVANSVQSGTIKEKSGLNIGFQFFANRSIPKYSDKQLEKSIKNANQGLNWQENHVIARSEATWQSPGMHFHLQIA